MGIDVRNNTFSLLIVNMVYIKDHFKRIGLDVEFLPGKASCTLNEESTVGNWVALNCMAPVGSLIRSN